MKQIIWSCWFQGIKNAPNLVQRCLGSWRDLNPYWEMRILDAETIRYYFDIDEIIDLQRKQITYASLSDILRIMLLHEYGGVWVDATALCNIPLKDWIDEAAANGFFAFTKPAQDRLLSSWFIAGDSFHPLINAWATATIRYWSRIECSSDYFWFHHLFSELVMRDIAIPNKMKQIYT